MEKRPSQIITDFLNFLEAADREYESAAEQEGEAEGKGPCAAVREDP